MRPSSLPQRSQRRFSRDTLQRQAGVIRHVGVRHASRQGRHFLIRPDQGQLPAEELLGIKRRRRGKPCRQLFGHEMAQVRLSGSSSHGTFHLSKSWHESPWIGSQPWRPGGGPDRPLPRRPWRWPNPKNQRHRPSAKNGPRAAGPGSEATGTVWRVEVQCSYPGQWLATY